MEIVSLCVDYGNGPWLIHEDLFLCCVFLSESISIGTKDDLLGSRMCAQSNWGPHACVNKRVLGIFFLLFYSRSGGVHGNCAKLTVRRRLRKSLMRLSCLMKDPFVFVSELFVKLDFV